MSNPTLANLRRQLANARRNQRAGLMAWVLPTAAGRVNPRSDPRYWQEVNATSRVRNLEARIATLLAGVRGARNEAAQRNRARRPSRAATAIQTAYRAHRARTSARRPTRNVGTSPRRSPSPRRRKVGTSPRRSPSPSRSRSRSRSRSPANNLNREALEVARLFNNASKHEGAGWIQQAEEAANFLNYKYGHGRGRAAINRALATLKSK